MIRAAKFFFALLVVAAVGWPAGAWAQDADEAPPATGAAASAPADADEGPVTGAPGQPPATDFAPMPEPTFESATVKAVAPGAGPNERHVTLTLTSGPQAGKEVDVRQHLSGQAGFDLIVVPGDEVVAVALTDPRDPSAPPQYQLADYQRGRQVAWVLAGLAVLLLLVGGARGLKTLGVLVLTGAAIVGALVPMTLQGWNPLPLGLLLAAAIALVTTLLTSGLGRKTWAAVLGTTGAAALATGLATFATGFARLSGVASDEAVGAAVGHGPINFAGLLAAGMVLGALGVVLDLALSISATVDELAESNPGLGRGLLFQAGMQVGRDMLSTSSNTLLLAYLGGFLPVLLTYGAQGLAGARLWHQEGLAAELVTLAVGLVGLVVAVPLTAAIATALQPPAAPPSPGAPR